MKILAFDEIKSILIKTQNEEFRFNEADRQRALTNPYLSDVRKALIREGDELRGTPILEPPFSAFKRFEIDGNRIDFESYYFKKRSRLTAFTLLVWLYGRDEDVRELENIVWAILNEYTWVLPAHLTKPCFANEKLARNRTGLSELQEDGYIIDLFSAETGADLAEMLSLVGDRLTPILVKRTELYIRERLLDIVHNDFMWKHTHNNWKAVCGGSCGIAALYQEKDIDALAETINMILPHLQDFCDSYTEDGACVEGLGYWNYGFGYFVYFADLLKRRTNGRIDLFDDEKVEKMALFFQKCFFPGGASVVFADSGRGGKFSPALTSYLASTYEKAIIPPLEFINLDYKSCTKEISGLRTLAWTDNRLEEKSKDICGVNIFDEAQWYLASSENGIGLAAKAGHNGEPHNHNDVGSFHISKNGYMTLADIGCGEYTKDYFGPLRYTYFCNTSASHNLPIVNGKYQEASSGKYIECSDEKAIRAARDVSIDESGLICDIVGAYDDSSLKKLVREIRFDKISGRITLTDRYEFSRNPESVIERFVSFDEPKLFDGKILFGNDEISTLTYDESILFAAPSTEVYNNHAGTPTTVYIVDLTVKKPAKEFAISIEIS